MFNMIFEWLPHLCIPHIILSVRFLSQAVNFKHRLNYNEQVGLPMPRKEGHLLVDVKILKSRHWRMSRYQEWSTTQTTSSKLNTTVGSIGVNMVQHPYGMLLTPYRVHTPTKRGCSEGKRGVKLNTRKVFLMFCTLSVHEYAIVI